MVINHLLTAMILQVRILAPWKGFFNLYETQGCVFSDSGFLGKQHVAYNIFILAYTW